MSTELCMTCRGAGQPGGCPQCKVDSFHLKNQVELNADILEANQIPTAYLDVEWDSELILASNSKYAASKDLQTYCGLLGKYILKLRAGDIPRKSLLIVAPHGYGKRTFMYCCMKEAIKKKMSTLEVIDTSMYRRMLTVSTERPFTKYLQQLHYDLEDIHTCDILFMTVDGLSYRNSYAVVDAVCEKRARYNKPTIITSRFSPREMSVLDYHRDVMKFMNSSQYKDGFKYPSLIMFTEPRRNDL